MSNTPGRDYIDNPKDKAVSLMYQNEDAYHTYGHSGLVPDWYLRYCELRDVLIELWDLTDLEEYSKWRPKSIPPVVDTIDNITDD